MDSPIWNNKAHLWNTGATWRDNPRHRYKKCNVNHQVSSREHGSHLYFVEVFLRKSKLRPESLFLMLCRCLSEAHTPLRPKHGSVRGSASFFPVKIKPLNHSSAVERTSRGLGPALARRHESGVHRKVIFHAQQDE